jgi:hypothetical protein
MMCNVTIAETRFFGTSGVGVDTIKIPRYTTIGGQRYVLYSIEEDNIVIKKLTEKKYLEQELEVCDSVVNVLKERENFYNVIVDDQAEQLQVMGEIRDMNKQQNQELKDMIEMNSKKERRKGRSMTALLVLGCIFTLGLLVLVILK